MSPHPPNVRRYVPPSDEDVAESRAAFDLLSAEADAKREASSSARRAAILGGPVLRDPDAAVDCRCACHPRPFDADLHDGGQSCPCQETETERAARLDDLFGEWSELAEELGDEEPYYREHRERFDAEAEALGVEARIEAWAAPFVIVGVCDWRGFYLRERHGSYRVTIAPDEDPGSDPWAAEPTEPSIDVAAGNERELDDEGGFSPAAALRVAVQSVRTAITRNACTHRRVDSEPYCPSCGVRIDEAQAWRWEA